MTALSSHRMYGWGTGTRFSWRGAGLDVVFVKSVEDTVLALNLVSCG
jgi:hypothetical protein